MEEMNLSEYKEHVAYNLVNATAERNEIFYGKKTLLAFRYSPFYICGY
jgi:hypothetical protein